jgi:2-oxoglutarate dehydrogenase E2 component (dihydrolipoamide succinyltransferase)
MNVDLVVPMLGESISEAIVAKWLKKVGEPLAVDEPVVELETDKVTVAVPAPVNGVLSERKFEEGATVQVGAIIGTLMPGMAPGKPAPTVAQPAAASAPMKPTLVPAPAAPTPITPPASAHPAAVPHSKTLPPSVRKALREGAQPQNGQVAPTPLSTTPTPSREIGPLEEVVPMSPLRKRIAQRLVEAQHTAAILTTFNEADMTNVMALRARFQEEFVKRHGIKLGFMSFFTRACVESLRNFPGLNAEIRGTDIVYKKHYDIGVAVGSGKGLVVPVLRGADRLDFAETEKEIARLADRAKTNQLTLEELSGGTFSITNGGIYGSMMSTPLLNLPQTGILGMHNIVKRPMAVGDQIALRPMMYLALSYDHRVVDGREAVQFLVGVKERIEAPDRLLLSL